MATLSYLGKGKGEDSTKWLPDFEAILEIRYHFTPTDKLEPIIPSVLIISFSPHFLIHPIAKVETELSLN